MHRCGTEDPPPDVLRRLRQHQHTASRVVDNGEFLHIAVRYWCLYHPNQGNNWKLSTFRAQHQIINASFNLQNLNAEHVPQSGHYNFYSVRGNAKIVLDPVAFNELNEDQVERLELPSNETTFSGLADVETYMYHNGYSPKTHELNVISAPLGGNLLGEARFYGSNCVILDQTVGGELQRGAHGQYHGGMTAVHEIGHMLGLPHPWYSTEASCTLLFSDVPTTKGPNRNFRLTQGTATNAPWEGALCNRDMDCRYFKDGNSTFASGAPHSCLDCYQTQTGCTHCDATDLFEQACNTMDYSPDPEMCMFSLKQCAHMRDMVINSVSSLSIVSRLDVPSVTAFSSAGKTLDVTLAPTESDRDGVLRGGYLYGQKTWIFITAVMAFVVGLVFTVVWSVHISTRIRSGK
jgi:hypothetical protein